MNSIKDRHLVVAENDPDYQALMKMKRKTNVFSQLLWTCFFLSLVPYLGYLLLCILERRLVAQPGIGQLLVWVPSSLGLFAMFSERVGERILDWRDARKALKQTEELISRLTENRRP